ncbi:oligosaccharide flippase family protein [Paraglaciecola sp. 25GB23A]|uniref:oligosaccharide flippase family protein n=1 Tax=Paraglaciecola sp. 25GB23A TaxID=3156068 RepID=UPI0032AFA861
MSKVRSALGYSVFSKWLSRAVNMASIVLIARLLTPEELGLFSIASAITLIAAELKSFGVGGYLIREEKINAEKVSNALGLSMILSWGAGLVMVIGSWAIADYYEMPDLVFLVQFLSISFFLSPHIGIGKSLLDRYFMFKHKMVAEIASQVCQFAAAITFIYLGQSYFSLAYSNAIGFGVELLIILMIKPALYTVKPAFNKMKGIAKFGIYVTGTSFVMSMNANMTALIVGKRGTAEEVAYLSRASGFISFLAGTITSGIRPVVTPYLASKKRDGERYAEAYFHAASLMSSIVIPALAVAGIASLPVITLFFGDQWGASAPLVSIMCIASSIHFLNTLAPSLLLTGGLEKTMFLLGLMTLILNTILIYFLYPFGLIYVPLADVVTAIMRFVFLSYLFKVKFEASIKTQLSSLLPIITLTATCSAWAFIFDHFIMPFSAENAAIVVPLLGVSTFLVWISTIILTNHPLKIELKRVVSKK